MGKFWTIVNGKRKRTAAGIKHEYEKFQSSTKAKKARAARNKARRHAIAEGRAHKGDGTDVHHSNGIKTERGARVMSARANRAKREKSRKKGSKRNVKRWGKD